MKLMQLVVVIALSFEEAGESIAATSLPIGSIIAGTVTYVRDGDTLVVGKTPIRIWGIAAPELSHSKGPAARSFVVANYQGKYLRCMVKGPASYDRQVALCRRDRSDIAIRVVSAGWARDCYRYSRGYYRQFETQASRQLPLPTYCK